MVHCFYTVLSELVSSLRIQAHAENGTATVSWTPRSEPLVDYRLSYESAGNSVECGGEAYVLYVPKASYFRGSISGACTRQS